MVAISLIYGVIFMILLALNYEHHLHRPGHPRALIRCSSTRETNHSVSPLSSASVPVTPG
jgi:hypothetical protein